MRSLISLFTGAGGLDLGLESAGFDVRLCVENDLNCQTTLQKNRPEWRLASPGDIFKLKPLDILKQANIQPGELDLLAGGPPCQPFSKASYWHRGDSLRLQDPRAKTLQSYMKIVEELLPRAILLENVEGIRFSNKDEGLQLLLAHFKRINRKHGTKYNPIVLAVNTADYGVPQLRRRVLLVAARDGSSIELPVPTHGPERKFSYMTAWDAIGDLDNDDLSPELELRGRWREMLPSIPEGCNYLWHTNRGGGRPLFGFRSRYWSFLLKLAKNKPSWTIQASPGPSTGPFHWKNRLLSTRELARLQTFPDQYFITGSQREAHRQIGNAVPPLIGEFIGQEIAVQIFGDTRTHAPLKFSIKRKRICPEPESISRVPKKYASYIGDHPAHPGEGKGPGAISRILVETR
jgi:DNA (cytosine-5)-methyltransferase 1